MDGLFDVTKYDVKCNECGVIDLRDLLRYVVVMNRFDNERKRYFLLTGYSVDDFEKLKEYIRAIVEFPMGINATLRRVNENLHHEFSAV